jgi:ribonuclease HI
VCLSGSLASVYPPTFPRRSTLLAFTDRSGGGKCGFGVVLCDPDQTMLPSFSFDDANCCVRLRDGSTKSGDSYAAELTGILAALLSVPLNCNLRIYTDSKSAIDVLLARVISTSRRHALGARSHVVTCRKLMSMRAGAGATTDFVHVPSHTEGKDIPSRGNAAADVEAGLGADGRAYKESRCTPFLTNEEQVVFWRLPAPADPEQELEHVSGNLRPVLMKAMRYELIRALQALKTQGATARLVGPRLLTHFDMVRRLGEDSLHMYFLLLVTCQLPIPDRVIWPRPPPESPQMQCIYCGIPSISIGHVYVCSATRSALTDFRSDVLKQLLVVTAAARSSDVLPRAYVALLGHALLWIRWYDPSSPPYHP